VHVPFPRQEVAGSTVKAALNVLAARRHLRAPPVSRSAASSLAAPSSTPWKTAGGGSSTYLVSDDAAFDARRTRSLQPPPRFTVWRWSRRSQSPLVNMPPIVEGVPTRVIGSRSRVFVSRRLW